MSDQNTPKEPAELMDTSGYEREGVNAEPAAEPIASNNVKPKKQGKNWDQLKTNFLSVFGQGIGKASILIAAFFIVIFSAIAYRSFRAIGNANQGSSATKVDTPDAPRPQVTIDEVSEREAARRANQANQEANEAGNKGQTYQPEFSPKIGSDSGQVQFDHAGNPISVSSQPGQGGQPGVPVSVAQQANHQAVDVVMPANEAAAAAAAQADAQRNQSIRAQQEEARTKYVTQVQTGVKEQAEILLGTVGKESGLRSSSRYSVVSYMPPAKPVATGSVQAANAASTSPVGATNTTAASVPKYAFRAGKVGYAQLDGEANTDDGTDVIATLHGGAYDGGKLIGKIEIAPRNIRLRFTSLTPPDDRPTLTINAIAIREEDAKQGVADSIDNHTLERYAALFVSSTLGGIAKAAAQPQGNVVILPNGQTITQNPELTNRRLAMFALGEVGVAAASEVRKVFDTPPTYKTNAKRGIGVVFLSDVIEK